MSQEYAVIDIETNGGRLSEAKITEISIFIFDGYHILDEFTTLINPCVPIPPFITDLTGIDNDMVSSAPLFEEVAEEIWKYTANRTFIAHNVGFDYGIIKEEFSRINRDFKRPTLCSVKLARKHLPGHRSYGLGNICKDLEIKIAGRHRARGDAEATVELLKLITKKNNGVLSMDNQTWRDRLPSGIDPETVEQLPKATGIIELYNKDGELIYIKTAKNIYQSVAALINSAKTEHQELIIETIDMVGVVTGSELIAALKAEQLIRNSNSKYLQKETKKKQFSIHANMSLFGDLTFKVDISYDHRLHYHQKSKAQQQLRKLMIKNDLCAITCHMSKSLCYKCLNKTCDMDAGVKLGDLEKAWEMIAGVYFKFSDFVIVDQGKNSSEKSFILIRNYQLAGFGYVELDNQIANRFIEWEQFVIQGSDEINATYLIWKFLDERKHSFKIMELQKELAS